MNTATKEKTDVKWPAHKLEKRNVEDLKPNPNNARLHNESHVKALVASIKEFGFTKPILIDVDNMIIAGHGRWMALRHLKAKEAPVIVAEGWSEEQKRAYSLADNQLGLLSEWDETLLKVEIGALVDLKFDVSVIGFPDVLQDLGFKPFMEPTADTAPVTAQDVEKAQTAADEQFAGRSEQNLAKVLCPHCDHIFTVDKDAL